MQREEEEVSTATVDGATDVEVKKPLLNLSPNPVVAKKPHVRLNPGARAKLIVNKQKNLTTNLLMENHVKRLIDSILVEAGMKKNLSHEAVKAVMEDLQNELLEVFKDALKVAKRIRSSDVGESVVTGDHIVFAQSIKHGTPYVPPGATDDSQRKKRFKAIVAQD